MRLCSLSLAVAGAGPPLRDDARMARALQVSGGGRLVLVPPERLLRWVEGFERRHGPARAVGSSDGVQLTAPDGTVAHLAAPWPPLAVPLPTAALAALVEHAASERVVGVLLVRLGGFAAGVFEGPRLVASKTGSRQVHGRAAAGGWSQQRFARRREGQARVALAAAADTAAAVLLPHVGRLAALVAGGDRASVVAVLADRRLAALRGLLAPDLLEVAEPRRAVLEQAGLDARAVRVTVRDAVSGPAGG